jgi:WD40 repeat protein
MSVDSSHSLTPSHLSPFSSHSQVWGITRFCISGHDAVKPVIEQQWAAHHQSINDIQCVLHSPHCVPGLQYSDTDVRARRVRTHFSLRRDNYNLTASSTHFCRLLEDRGVLLTASNDCAVRLWNIQGGKHTADYIGAFCARTSGYDASPSPEIYYPSHC